MSNILLKVSYFFAFLSVILSYGCAVTKPKDTEYADCAICNSDKSHKLRSINEVDIGIHIWDIVFSEKQEYNSDFGIYTYVLINQDFSQDAASNRYKELLNTIKSSSIKKELYSKKFQSKTNIFLLPSLGKGSPNTFLSKKIINIFSVLTKNKRLKQVLTGNPGPFLISTAKPISILLKDNKLSTTLYIDLSRINISAIGEVVRAYKNRIVASPINSEEEFWSIRLAILNILLNSNDSIDILKDSIGIIKDAYAE